MEENKTIVDFFGLPGAGKTTICNTIIEIRLIKQLR